MRHECHTTDVRLPTMSELLDAMLVEVRKLRPEDIAPPQPQRKTAIVASAAAPVRR